MDKLTKFILAHSDIAPFRKRDPGKYFPWKLLENEKIISNFQSITKNDTKIIEDWFNKYNINAEYQPLNINENEIEKTSIGNGPVAALDKALSLI